jgi:hypothetical protein
MAKNANNQKTVTIDDQEFVLQHPGVRAGVQLRDRSKNMNGVLEEEAFYEELMKHVIVSPKVTWESADEMGNKAFQELMKEASSFLMGKTSS